jgi:hypothetical protein
MRAPGEGGSLCHVFPGQNENFILDLFPWEFGKSFRLHTENRGWRKEESRSWEIGKLVVTFIVCGPMPHPTLSFMILL